MRLRNAVVGRMGRSGREGQRYLGCGGRYRVSNNGQRGVEVKEDCNAGKKCGDEEGVKGE